MKKILILLLLTSILGYLYFYEPKKEEEFTFLSNKNFETLNWFSIVNQNSIFRVSRKNNVSSNVVNNWQIDQPVITNVSAKFLSKLKEILIQAQNIKSIKAEQSNFGLNPPKLVLTLQSGQTREIYSFGDYNEISSLRYFQKEGDSNIYLVDDDIFNFLNVDLLKLRAKKPVSFNDKDILSIVAIPASTKPIVIKKQNSRWKVNDNFFIDSNLLTKALSKVKNSQVLNFIDNPHKDLTNYGLNSPFLSLRFLLSGANKNSKVIDLIFSKTKKSKLLPSSYYMKVVGRNTIYRVFKGSFHDWLRGVDFFRNRKILESSCKLDSEIANSDKIKVKDLYALNIISLSEFKKSNKSKIVDFICNKNKVKIEIGEALKSGISKDRVDAPLYIKVNNEYTAVVSPEDIFW